ncbi:polyphosphate kinase 2 family protein [Deinococcus aquaedulcis]|uniref:polyphosphate kinase 2 family protein n=1 Tax=Deinococcus aquaedulcis TaxID=2840455 RepID=UPI001C8326EC|nr:polyphosphate kinase 2 family protein [Deinococcus aquaedulcis]
MKLEPYRVAPRTAPCLADWATDEHGGLKKEEGQAQTATLLPQIADLQERLYAENKQALLIVLQARDAGGKDGTVKHVFGALNPNGVRVSNFKAPTPEEQAHDFLWRVHAQAPRHGIVGIFNRSHYEDVLVPAVQGHLDEKAIQRRLEHIRAFEALLADHGTRILKFYLHISPEQQRSRLQERLNDPTKHWKFNPSDLEARAQWDDYTRVYETILATSTEAAPWYVIPADRKWFRNLLISHVVLSTLQDMNPAFPTPNFDPKSITIA